MITLIEKAEIIYDQLQIKPLNKGEFVQSLILNPANLECWWQNLKLKGMAKVGPSRTLNRYPDISKMDLQERLRHINLEKLKLKIELIPQTAFAQNLRTVFPNRWKSIRKKVLEKYGYKCSICQSQKGKLECHESWEFDDELHIQSLSGLSTLCYLCHLAKHIGHAESIGKAEIAKRQMIRIDHWNQNDLDLYISLSIRVWQERSKFEWTMVLGEFEKLLM